MKFVITGATGGLGSQVFKYLLRLVPASDIIVSLYNPSGATQEITQAGVEIRRGDFSEPASLDTAFAGADKLLIVSYPSIAHELRVKNHISAIDAAKRCGIKHIYYTSLGFGGGKPESVAAVMQAHLDTERYLQQSGVTYTILREGIYSESYPLYFGFFDPQEGKDEVLIPHADGPISWVSREDLGEVTAKIMVQGGYEDQLLLLTGSRALTLKDIADMASQFLNRTITVRTVSEDEYVRVNVGREGPRGEDEFLRKWATTYKALERGEAGVVDPLVQQILGRELKPFERTLKEVLGVSGNAGIVDRYAK